MTVLVDVGAGVLAAVPVIVIEVVNPHAQYRVRVVLGAVGQVVEPVVGGYVLLALEDVQAHVVAVA